jgi:hypothetical protein
MAFDLRSLFSDSIVRRMCSYLVESFMVEPMQNGAGTWWWSLEDGTRTWVSVTPSIVLVNGLTGAEI